MLKKIICATVILILLTCSYFVVSIRAATLGEQKQEITEQKQEAEQKLIYIQEDLSEAIVKIQELDDQIKAAQSDIDSLETELQGLQEQIDVISEKLEVIEANYLKNEELLKQRIVVMYEVGETTYLDILLNSKNIIDFLSNYYIIEQIIESDTQLLKQKVHTVYIIL